MLMAMPVLATVVVAAAAGVSVDGGSSGGARGLVLGQGLLRYY